jgi:hypothetical protein
MIRNLNPKQVPNPIAEHNFVDGTKTLLLRITRKVGQISVFIFPIGVRLKF